MLDLTVTGMTCDHCAAAVERAIRALPGVADVAVDQPTGHVRVGGTPDRRAIEAAIREEGYEVAAPTS